MESFSDSSLKTLQSVLDRFREQGRTGLIPALLSSQEIYGYLPEQVVEGLGQQLSIPLVEIYGVIEFYSMLYSKPMGQDILRICTSPMCAAVGGIDLYRRLREEFDDPKLSLPLDLALEEVACLGLCDHAPAGLRASEAVCFPTGFTLNAAAVPIPSTHTLQVGGSPRWLTQRIGQDPLDIKGYQASGGFVGLRKALMEMTREQVIQEIKTSGLSGRGGAAFPTGLKWELTAAASEPQRYLICNADESEPGTFKDRILLEGDPFSVLEGMLLGAYAVEARRGYLFIRGEYPRAQAVMGEAIRIVEEAGFLGKGILGTDFTFHIELRSGAGAYICGEETALFEAIEGKRGYPRLKPPFPTTHGLFGKPTVINNVETLSAVTWILANGSQAFRSLGTGESPGTKLFCLSGDVPNRGVYEVPFGISLGELVDLAGGVQGSLQGVLLGGAAGSFVTAEEMHLRLSFEDLHSAGLSLGSGVVFVFNEHRQLSVILSSLAQFFAHESCGKCFPCQLGTQRQLEIVDRWAQGEARPADHLALEDVVFAMSRGSICGLGVTAGTAVESAYQRWPELWDNPSPTRMGGGSGDE